jgi:nitrogen regulatory protein P-II 1
VQGVEEDTGSHWALAMNFTSAGGAESCNRKKEARLAAKSKDNKMMTKIEAIIQPSRFEAVKETLTELGIGGMTISDVRGHGRQKGHTEVYRGREYTVDLLPKVKLEMVLPDEMVDPAVEAILKSASSGKIGDGKIFLSKVEQTIRIRNQERGAMAL